MNPLRASCFLVVLGSVLIACGSSTNGASGPRGSDTGGIGKNPPAGVAPDGLFMADHFFYRDVSAMPPASESNAIIRALGAWGNGDRFDITFDFHVLEASKSTPTAAASEVEYEDESDVVPFPVPAGGAVEGQSDYRCVDGGDCHLIVVQQDIRKLFELYAANQAAPDRFTVGSMAVWNLDKHYDEKGRGLGCTSADAAGFPILPGLIRVNEVVVDKEIKHALRFILPNPSMRRSAWVAPATHYGGPSSANADSPPYGVRFRLKSSFDEGRIASPGGKVVVRALKKYGMLLSDGGNIALTGESDRLTTAKWNKDAADHVLNERDLRPLKVSDFEVVDFAGAETFADRPDCRKEP